MNHAEAREALELAAVEPGGIERVEAGDTAEARALAGHLLECASCAAEWDRLRAASVVLRAAIRPRAGSASAVAEPLPADLRDRTLRLVREVGRPRPMIAPVVPPAHVEAAPVAPIASAAHTRGDRPISLDEHRRRRFAPGRPARATLARLGTIAAVLVLAVAMAGFAYSRQQASDQAQHERAAIAEVAADQARLAGAPDVRTVQLWDANHAVQGQAALSASRGDVVMVALNLPPAPAGKVYRCWIETSGVRQVLGPVEMQGGLGYWSGWSAAVHTVAPGTRFGVSLADATATTPSQSAPILTGVVGS